MSRKRVLPLKIQSLVITTYSYMHVYPYYLTRCANYLAQAGNRTGHTRTLEDGNEEEEDRDCDKVRKKPPGKLARSLSLARHATNERKGDMRQKVAKKLANAQTFFSILYVCMYVCTYCTNMLLGISHCTVRRYSASL